MPSYRPRRWRTALVAATTAAAAVVVPQAAHADPPVVYAALGDSASIGPGPGYLSLPYDLTLTCGRTVDAYPVQWRDAHPGSTLLFHACGGATTTSVISSQLDGLDEDTTLVTVTAGGNDFGVVQGVVACHLGYSTCDSTWDSLEADITDDLPDLLDAMYDAIKTAAPNAQIIQIGLPGIFDTSSSTCSGLPDWLNPELDQAERIRVTQGGLVLQNVTAARAAANGVTFINTMPYFAGHRICQSDPWVDGLVGLAPYHPNPGGHDAFLTALTDVTG